MSKLTYDDCIDYINQSTADQYTFFEMLHDADMPDITEQDNQYDDSEFITLDELIAAYEDCRQKKKGSPSYHDFKVNEIENLLKLYHELNDRTYQIGESICFVINQTKLREVFAADFRDRIVHHLIIKRFIKYFENYFIENSYSCRVGKGTLKGIDDVQEAIKKFDYDCYVYKGDIKNFFMSINKNILAENLENFIRSQYNGPYKEEWINLIKMEALHRPQDNCEIHGSAKLLKKLPDNKSLFTTDPECGLAIGNLTSQIFANFYMSGFDHYMNTYSPNIFYARYVDDFVIISKDKELILDMVSHAREYLKTLLHLDLHDKKQQLQHSSKGFPFLGNIIKNERRYMINRTIHKAFHIITNTILPIKKYIQLVNSYLGYFSSCDTYDIRKKLWDAIPAERKYFLQISSDYKKVSINKEKYEIYTILVLKIDKYTCIPSTAELERQYAKEQMIKEKPNKKHK